MKDAWLVRLPVLPRTVGVAALLSLLMPLAACGGESNGRLTHDEYQRAILRIVGGDDARAATSLYTESVAYNFGRETCAAKVQQLHRHLKAIVEEVERLRPPADAEAAQREFLVPARASVETVGEAADEVGSDKLRCGRPLNRRLYHDMPSRELARQVVERFEKRGDYVVFGR